MTILAAGINHRTAPIEVRERCVYPPREVLAAIAAVRAASDARECVALSTCNRTEFYLVEADGRADGAAAIWDALSGRAGTDAEQIGYVLRDRDAVRHLMHVASGLDSMVLGEAQITGQVRDAWEASRAHSGPVLNRLFHSALGVAGRVRAETAIGRGAALVSSAAVLLAKKIFGSLHGRRAMVLGAGDAAELALECLRAEGVRVALVANRTFEHANELARRHGAVALRYDDCWPELATVDVLVCSTAAPHPVVSRDHVGSALADRRDRPLCILDIALPRDVDPSVRELDNVFLYDLDDLRAAVAANVESRRAELPTAEQLVDGEVERYWQWLAGSAAVPVVAGVRAAMDQVRADELAQIVRRLGDLTPRQRELIDHFSHALMNKFLHEPSVRLRAAAANGRGLGIVDAARYLFALDEARSGDGDGAQSRSPPEPTEARPAPAARPPGAGAAGDSRAASDDPHSALGSAEDAVVPGAPGSHSLGATS